MPGECPLGSKQWGIGDLQKGAIDFCILKELKFAVHKS